MSRFKKNIIISTVCIFLCSLSISVSAQKDGPEIKLIKTFKNIKGFSDREISNEQIIAGKNLNKAYPAMTIYDIKSNSSIDLDIVNFIGYQKAPKVLGYERKKLEAQGKLFSWSRYELLHYNKNQALLALWKRATTRIIQGAPQCQECNETSKFIEKYQRYYCYKCRKYVDKDVYLKTGYSLHLAEIDLGKNEITKQHHVKDNSFNILGATDDGNQVYFYEQISMYKKTESPSSLNVYRYNLKKGKIDWQKKLDIPVRKKGEVAGAFSIRGFASKDFSKIAFWEYDELYEGRKGKGWLRNPFALGMVVDTKSGSVFRFEIPVTAYGYTFTRDNKYLIIGSNQLAQVFVYDLDQKKLIKTGKSYANICKLILTENEKYLLVFNKTNIDCLQWPSLKRQKTIPYTNIQAGVTKLLVSVDVWTNDNATIGAIGVMKKSARGPWWSVEEELGINIFSIKE